MMISIVVRPDDIKFGLRIEEKCVWNNFQLLKNIVGDHFGA